MSVPTVTDRHDVVVVGGGLAGLAAAASLAEAGVQTTLLEWRPYVGGRAYSYEHPALGETIDSQHVVLGCCTNAVDLLTRAGIADWIRWYDKLTFLEPNGRRSLLKSGPLPAPFHQTGSFLRASMLSLADKAGIARGLLQFLRGYPTDDGESFAYWLKRTGQTERAVKHFWEPVVVGALNDSFDRCSLKYAGKIFYESFLRSAEAGRLGIPTRPLSDFFQPVAQFAVRNGAELRLRSAVRVLAPTSTGWCLTLNDGSVLRAGQVILAMDFRSSERLLAMLPEALSTGQARLPGAMVSAPITTVHLWYDRDVTNLDHAVLLDTRIQWVFVKSRIRGWTPERGSYQELVISASHAELELSRERILRSAIEEFEGFFPLARTAQLRKSAVLKEARATFSVVPGLDALRPEQKTAWPGLFLAGDWTRTEWPSTMEGAIRSGRLAAGALLGQPHRFLSPELPPGGWMRLFDRN